MTQMHVTTYRCLYLLALSMVLMVSISCGRDSGNGRQAGEYEDYEDEGEIEDGTHSATVHYYNPETGHTATYSLDVDVEDGEVYQINFPKGGWLDDSHISPTELEDGSATIIDDEGREFEVEIDDY